MTRQCCHDNRVILINFLYAQSLLEWSEVNIIKAFIQNCATQSQISMKLETSCTFKFDLVVLLLRGITTI